MKITCPRCGTGIDVNPGQILGRQGKGKKHTVSDKLRKSNSENAKKRWAKKEDANV